MQSTSQSQFECSQNQINEQFGTTIRNGKRRKSHQNQWRQCE